VAGLDIVEPSPSAETDANMSVTLSRACAMKHGTCPKYFHAQEFIQHRNYAKLSNLLCEDSEIPREFISCS
jgi:hypothetical protein